jgi:hypothetical protein
VFVMHDIFGTVTTCSCLLRLQVDNFYTTTSVSWKPDGSKLAVGSLTGAVDVYDACLKRYK